MGQLHYVSLHRGTFAPPRQRQQIQANQQPLQFNQQQCQPSHLIQQHTAEQEDKEQAEDEEAFHSQAQLRGLPYDTVMQKENVSPDSIFSVAPGEGQKPLSILADESFEEKCNPTKYTTGKFGLMANREKKLIVRKYFN